MSAAPPHSHRDALHHARWELLDHLSALLEKPMIALSFVWLWLIIEGFTHGLSRRLSDLSYAIWAVFVLDFALEFTVAPHKAHYLRKHWLTAVSLLLPALGVFRLFRVVQVLLTAHAAGYLSLLRVVTSLNRGLAALRKTMQRRGVGYIIAFTALVIVGAAGMLGLESQAAVRQAGYPNGAQPGDGLHGYADALWFTAMLMTSLGSAYEPFTAAGRVLCWLLALYGLSVFGYITAAVASHFVGQDQSAGPDAPAPGGAAGPPAPPGAAVTPATRASGGPPS